MKEFGQEELATRAYAIATHYNKTKEILPLKHPVSKKRRNKFTRMTAPFLTSKVEQLLLVFPP